METESEEMAAQKLAKLKRDGFAKTMFALLYAEIL